MKPIAYFNDGEGLIIRLKNKKVVKCFFESGDAFSYNVPLTPSESLRLLVSFDFHWRGVIKKRRKK